MSYLLNGLYLLFLTATFPFWLYKSLTTGKYREGMWAKLTGQPPTLSDDRPVIWIHAVSVGEVILLRPLLARLQADRPDLQPVLSATTNTGYAVARERYPDLPVFYTPLDFTWSIGRVLDALQPRLLVLTELELWPNLLLLARRRGVPVAVVNARLSERSFRGYRRIAWLLRPALSAIKWWGAQSETYARRINELIGPNASATVTVTGSMKYEGAPTDRGNPKTGELRRLLGFAPDEKIFIAGSTAPGEDEVALDAFVSLTRSYPTLRLIVVPRQRERFDAVAELLNARGIEHVRRSQIDRPLSRSAPVTLVDTIGELAAVWGLADYAFVGGSLGGKRGGQSMIEPAGYGVPLCFGPEVWNFQDTVDKLIEMRAAIQLHTPADLLRTLQGWLAEPLPATELGHNARKFILEQQGSVDATFRAIDRWVPASTAQRRCA